MPYPKNDLPIRVLHVIGGLEVGGAESRLMDIYRRIDRSKVQFDFVQHMSKKCHFEDEVHKLGGRVFSVPRFTGKNLLLYIRAWRNFFIAHPEYQIVHGHATSTAFIYLEIARQCGVATRIAHARSTNAFEGVRRITRQFAPWSASHLMAVSGLAGAAEFGQHRADQGEITVIPNAVNVAKFAPSASVRQRMRQEWQVRDDQLVFGHIGRLHPAKNHDFLLQAFAEIIKLRPDAQLIIVGDGELREKIKNQIDCLDLSDCVHLLGLRSDVPDLLQGFDALIFPSHYEGFPGVVLEAQAAGLPTLLATTITDEVCLTPLARRIPLSQGSSQWAVQAIELAEQPYQNGAEMITQAGYDIAQVTDWYQHFYLQQAKALVESSGEITVETTLTESDIAGLARLHTRAFDGFFLTSLGELFLRQFYRGYLYDSSAVNVIARDKQRRAVGVIVGTVKPQRFFIRLLRRQLLQFMGASALAALHNPAIAFRLLAAVGYRGDTPSEVEGALLSSICVDPTAGGQGIGSRMLTRWVAELRRRGVDRAFLTTDAADNAATNQFYRKAGWQLHDSFTTARGRAMNRYRFDLAPVSVLDLSAPASQKNQDQNIFSNAAGDNHISDS